MDTTGGTGGTGARVLLLATKDTMAYARRPGRAVATGAELLRTVPAGLLTADVTVEDVPAEPSWDISPGTMLALARRARAAILEEGFSGVVVLHGTDTLEETAFLTDLLAGPAVPRGAIVFTGAERLLDDLSADGPRNLASAITAASDPALAGVGVLACLNDELHAARWVTKVDATSVAAFSSLPYPQFGRVVDGRVELLATPPPRPPWIRGDPELDVALIKTFPGIEDSALTSVVDAGARGVVLEGTGAGNIPACLLATVRDLIEWDIPVVIASRCRTRDAELTDLSMGAGLAGRVGAIAARGLPAAKARYALMVALGSAGDPAPGDPAPADPAPADPGGAVAAVRNWFGRW